MDVEVTLYDSNVHSIRNREFPAEVVKVHLYNSFLYALKISSCYIVSFSPHNAT